jgi:hypothetical protein
MLTKHKGTKVKVENKENKRKEKNGRTQRGRSRRLE